MKLANSVMLLNTQQILHLQDVLVSAGLAFETGGDYRGVFRAEKNKHPVGVQHRIYNALYKASLAEIDALLTRLIPKQVKANA